MRRETAWHGAVPHQAGLLAVCHQGLHASCAQHVALHIPSIAPLMQISIISIRCCCCMSLAVVFCLMLRGCCSVAANSCMPLALTQPLCTHPTQDIICKAAGWLAYQATSHALELLPIKQGCHDDLHVSCAVLRLKGRRCFTYQ